MIFVSTGGLRNQPAWKIVEDILKSGISNIELSGGTYHVENLTKLKILKSKINFQIHNYFPPPKTPFVFNLASLNSETAKRSVKQAQTAIDWALELESSFYGFHAGFLIDPNVNELGKRMNSRSLYEYNAALSLFLEKVNDLAEYARKRDVELLIENNVCSAENKKEFKINPFLMTNSDECIYIMKNTPSNVNLLIDVAHLKVSAISLQFDPVLFLKHSSPWVKGYHLSDNDGFSDSNEIMTETSWFWPHINKNLRYYTIEVYNYSADVLSGQIKLASKLLGELND